MSGGGFWAGSVLQECLVFALPPFPLGAAVKKGNLSATCCWLCNLLLEDAASIYEEDSAASMQDQAFG